MRLPAVLVLPLLMLPACAAGPQSRTAEPAEPSASATPALAELIEPGEGAQVVAGVTATELSTATSEALYASAAVVVLAGDEDAPAQARAASVAVELGVPLLLAPTGAARSARVLDEVRRLAPRAVLVAGAPAASWAEQLPDVELVSVDADDGHLAELDGQGLPVTASGERATGTVVLASPDPGSAAAVATAEAAGAEVVTVPDPDPRADSATVQRLTELRPSRVLGLGSAFGESEPFAARVATAATGVELPGGGQLILPGKRYVALYGHPGTGALGVLGEQGPEASVARAARLAAEYAAQRQDAQVVPTFEIITTVADSSAGTDGDYSSESSLDHVRPYVDAAAASGTYVVLDLQPGYADFLTQAKRYEELLRLPHVGLALDPEWRLAPGQRHMAQIGRVSADEVNSVVEWLAALVREHQLPQKMLLLHQFKIMMLEDREQIVADLDEVSVITQMDGHGPPSVKLETWRAIRQDPPAGMTFGWKNFYDEDSPTLTPAQTLAVEPTPVFISYQ